ncbi:MAG: glycosyltransferase family 9 protein [Bacteroidales bacterium]|nr:glycosyltransferase family 9 protein [Bacteroidales bacterium]
MKKILIIRFSSIGDIVLTTPIIRVLKNKFPKTEIHYLTKSKFSGILEHNPYLTTIHHYDKSLKEVLPLLKQKDFDLIIDLHKNIRSALVQKRLGVKSLSFDKLNLEKWLLVRFKINRLPKKHLVDRYFDALSSLGIENDQLGLDYFEGKDNANTIDNLPKEFKKSYIVFALAGTYFTKKIPFEKWIEMAKNSPLPIVLLGGNTERELGLKITNEPLQELCYNACGTLTLNQSAALIKSASLVVTGDTGLMHIAAAYKKKIASLWGNTVPDFGMYPYLPQSPEKSYVLENKDLSCRPCSKLGFDSCPKKHFNCMMQLDVSNVFHQISEKDFR